MQSERAEHYRTGTNDIKFLLCTLCKCIQFSQLHFEDVYYHSWGTGELGGLPTITQIGDDACSVDYTALPIVNAV